MTTTSFSHSQLLLSALSPSVVISGHHIQTIESSSGKLITSTASWTTTEQEALEKSGPIRHAVLNTSRVFLATVADDKFLKVWDISGETITLSSERELPKKPTSVAFSADSQNILVSDKFGDIFAYSLHPSPPDHKTDKPAKDRTSLVSHPSTSGTLILGHTSLLTTFLLSQDEKYIITADRDEHIRVSWYPQGYCIECYCLGCTRFISALHIPASQPSLLISGGGDLELKLWDWMSGELKYDLPIWDSVQSYIKVKVKPYKKGHNVDDEGDEDRPKANKRRRKAGKEKDSGRDEMTPIAESEHIKEETEDETVLVVQKIDTFEHHETVYMVFSIVGATALFTMPLPNEDNSHPEVSTYVLDKPVLDFCILPGKSPTIWISVDESWRDDNESELPGLVRVAEFSEYKFRSLIFDDPVGMLLTLNSTCLISGDTRNLDLYAALKSLPKNTHAEHNAMERLEEIFPEQLSKKEMGKMKSKKAIEERERKAIDGDNTM